MVRLNVYTLMGVGMKKIFLGILAFCSLLFPAHSQTPNDPPGLSTFLNAVRVTETGGMPNDGIGAIGDNGTSLGPYQISYAYWVDAQMPYGTWNRCLVDKAYSEEVMKRYWRRYCPNAYKNGNWEILARVHNGGPSGFRKQATIRYWNTVKRIMNN